LDWAHCSYRYVPEQERYQFIWESAPAFSVFSGGFEDNDTTLALYEFQWSGDASKLTMSRPNHPVRYTFSNISADQFLLEWQEDRDGEQIYEMTLW